VSGWPTWLSALVACAAFIAFSGKKLTRKREEHEKGPETTGYSFDFSYFVLS
jgi:hypothetical protein